MGFLDLGFEIAGFNNLSCNEVHRPFVKAYTHARQNMGLPVAENVYVCSIENVLSEKLILLKNYSDLKGFIGGPPCPDFSVAGKQRGRYGNNGRLSETYAQIIIEQSPDWFLFENVKGLWKTKKHRKFYDELCKEFIKADYCITDKLINSLEYGVPQDRERIILLGFKKKLLRCKTARFLKDGEFPWSAFTIYNTRDVLQLNWPKTNPFGEVPNKPDNCPEDLMIQNWFDTNEVEKHPNAQDFFQPRAGLTRFQSIEEGDDSRKSYKRLHRWRYSPTVAYGNNEVHLHPYKARRLSVSEALAIQSLPKNYVIPKELTLTSMFKGIGNGVPYLAAKGLAETIKFFLSEV